MPAVASFNSESSIRDHKANAASGSCRTPRRLKLPTDWLVRRTAKPHRDFIGAVLCASVAYLIGVTHVAPSHTDEVLIGPVVGYRRDHHPITVDVDIGRVRPTPCEIHRLPVLHPAP